MFPCFNFPFTQNCKIFNVSMFQFSIFSKTPKLSKFFTSFSMCSYILFYGDFLLRSRPPLKSRSQNQVLGLTFKEWSVMPMANEGNKSNNQTFTTSNNTKSIIPASDPKHCAKKSITNLSKTMVLTKTTVAMSSGTKNYIFLSRRC